MMLHGGRKGEDGKRFRVEKITEGVKSLACRKWGRWCKVVGGGGWIRMYVCAEGERSEEQMRVCGR